MVSGNAPSNISLQPAAGVLSVSTINEGPAIVLSDVLVRALQARFPFLFPCDGMERRETGNTSHKLLASR